VSVHSLGTINGKESRGGRKAAELVEKRGWQRTLFDTRAEAADYLAQRAPDRRPVRGLRCLDSARPPTVRSAGHAVAVRSSPVNLINLVRFASVPALGYYIGRVAAESYGGSGWIAGGIAGGLLAICANVGLSKGADLWTTVRPVRPVCRLGRCSAEDYEVLEVGVESAVLLCRCGTRYRRSGPRLMELLEDGSTRPYMYWTLRHGWRSETGT
jgi:hypothetical protein